MEDITVSFGALLQHGLAYLGKPGPVDDWTSRTAKKTSITESEKTQIDTDESGGFGKEFDPSKWI